MAKPQLPKEKSSPSAENGPQKSLEELLDRQIGDLVNQKQRDVIVSRVTSLLVREQFSGPLPHPKHLLGYEEISPGAADRIISMAERDQSHQIQMDKDILAAEKSDRKLGMWLGWGAFVFLVVCALASAAITGSQVIPGLFLGTAAIGGVSLFVRGRNSS